MGLRRRIEEHTDALGRRRRAAINTITVQDEQTLERVLERLDKALELAGRANVLCHWDHWVDAAEDGWAVTVRFRALPSLEEELQRRRSAQEELICLSSDPETARQQLLRYQDRQRLSDETVLRLGLDICRGLEQGLETGLDRCAVGPDTIYRTDSGRWLLGGMGLELEGQTGTVGLARVLHLLLGGTDGIGEPPLGAPELRGLVGWACQEELALSQLRLELERLAGYRPEPPIPEGPVEEPAQEEDSALERLLAALTEMDEEEQPQPDPWWSGAGIERFKVPDDLCKEHKDMTDQIRKKVHLSTMISAGDGITAALRKNGTVLSTRMFAGLDGWDDISAVAAGGSHILGLRNDGRVRVVGNDSQGQCQVSGWRDIIQIAAGANHSVGLRADGTVLAVGKIAGGQYQVYQWKDIAAIAAGAHHIVGLRKDGTVVAEGSDLFCQCDVAGWENIIAVSAGGEHTVGLRTDGTVVATGANRNGQCNVEHWADIIAVDAGFDHTVGLKADGTVVISGSFPELWKTRAWADIIAVSAGRGTTVALRSDGRLLALGKNDHGQCDVGHWTGMI